MPDPQSPGRLGGRSFCSASKTRELPCARPKMRIISSDARMVSVAMSPTQLPTVATDWARSSSAWVVSKAARSRRQSRRSTRCSAFSRSLEGPHQQPSPMTMTNQIHQDFGPRPALTAARGKGWGNTPATPPRHKARMTSTVIAPTHNVWRQSGQQPDHHNDARVGHHHGGTHATA